jgi:hypothetical protein
MSKREASSSFTWDKYLQSDEIYKVEHQIKGKECRKANLLMR